jgi:hypothetical protein
MTKCHGKFLVATTTFFLDKRSLHNSHRTVSFISDPSCNSDQVGGAACEISEADALHAAIKHKSLADHKNLLCDLYCRFINGL